MNLYQPTISGSLTVSGSVEIIGPFTMSGGSISGTSSFAANAGLLQGLDSTSFVGTGSFNSMSSSVSTRVTTIESKYATTGSNIFTGAQTVCANITSTGTIIAQTLNVQQVTSSVVYSSGSNVFGNLSTDVQQFTGSVLMTGSLNVFGRGCVGIGLNTTNPVVTVENAGIYGSWVELRATSTGGKRWIVQSTGVSAGEGTGNFVINNQTDGISALVIATSGSACFLCSVTVGGYLTGQGVNPGGLGGSRYVLDWLSGEMRIFSYGANTTTNGGFVFNSQRCDGTNSTDFLKICNNGAAVFSSSITAGGNIQTNGSTNKYIKATGFISNQIGQLSDFSSTDIGFYALTNGEMQFVAAGSNAARINSLGNVGIGVTSLLSPGNSRKLVQIASGSNGAIVALGSSTSESSNPRVFSGQYDLGFAAGVTTGNIVMYTNDTERLRIYQDGKVLIQDSGNANSSYSNLTLANNSADDTIDFTKGITFVDNASNEGTWTHAGIVSMGSTGYNGNLIFGTDGSGTRTSSITERMRIKSSGVTSIGRLPFCFETYLPTGYSSALQLSNGILKTRADNEGNHVLWVGSCNTTAPLGVVVGFRSHTTTAACRFPYFIGTEIGASPSHIAFNPDGGNPSNILIHTYQSEGVGWTFVGPSPGYAVTKRSGTAGQAHISFQNGNGQVGYIATDGTTTSYVTNSSDLRMKKNFESWNENISSLFSSILPKKFNYCIECDDIQKTKGFIAQCMIDKFPEAYPADQCGNYSFNPSGMVVYLMKAIQEQQCQIYQLRSCLGIA